MREPFVYLTSPPNNADAVARTFAIGKFDGLHIAHQAVLRQAVSTAQKTHSTPCVFTFSPHPRFVLINDPAYEKMLTPPYERAAVAKRFGIEELYVANFDTVFRTQSAEEFLAHYLIPLGANHIVVGYNFHFGKNGATDALGLCRIAEQMGITIDVIDSVQDHGHSVSSSLVRMNLELGDVVAAGKLLGRPYRMRGMVVRGDARGRTIGFPTANLTLTEPYVLPKTGVYVVAVEVDDAKYRGMMNLGYRPTVESALHISLEVHLLDFDGDLYGKELIVDVLYFIRDEERFASLESLREQLGKDREFVQNWSTN